MNAKVFTALASAIVIALAPPPAHAFYLIQIEQVIGGVSGDTSAQAIQLRLRFPDTKLEWARLRAWDSAGENPILLVDFDRNLANGSLGAHVLITSPNFADYTEVSLSRDFELTNLIPPSYLAAGRITYEYDFDGPEGPIIFWSLSFGGAAYTGPTEGESYNDADGEFGPPFDGPCPSDSGQALRFQGSAMDLSTTNADDYALTAGPAVFINNAGMVFRVVPSVPTLSQWGLVVMALLILGAGTVMLARRRPVV